ncbi:hypothetical protein UFOVP592_25 [uncultured Caudovirales phage]|uniref:Uncharacterized protein n=1 Tax=uncultured Caudovirales phage TaxID=2100421 RepID=A0A6J5MWE4_9CAUD|nr:hypothetical protein UFOVP592_25 [uncultured Caudovirales phage]
MPHTWNLATPADSQDIMNLNLMVQYEVDTIFNFNPNVLSHHIVTALVNQFYSGKSDLVATARDENNKLLAYTWVKTGERSMWSSEEVASVRMAHVDPNLSVRQRILLLDEMIELWERFAQLHDIPIIHSNTLRQEQAVFLKLHSRAGYVIRGSVAYKRVNLLYKPTKLFL